MAPSRGQQTSTRRAQNTKKASSRTSQKQDFAGSADSQPVTSKEQEDGSPKFCQRLLNVFANAFPHLASDPDAADALKSTIQLVKGHLYDRDFRQAFAKREYLEAYAIRWSSSRALCYLSIFAETFHRFGIFETVDAGTRATQDASNGTDTEEAASQPRAVNVTCLGGGGGAELCAIAAAYHHLQVKPVENSDESAIEETKLHVHVVDIADWSPVIESLHRSLITAPSLSAYASASAKAANAPVVSAQEFASNFNCRDVLADSSSLEIDECIAVSDVITLMFTLNELYSTSQAQTQSFLLDLTGKARGGALLLVVDSAGSYSTVSVNSKEKKYPMLWLLEHVLFKIAPNVLQEKSAASEVMDDRKSADEENDRNPEHSTHEHNPVWERVYSTESRWFRLPGGLQYCVELEDMRFQMHVYRRL